ncbi:MAG: NUDIX hydrolase [Candidatus Paceibacterota bacterium]
MEPNLTKEKILELYPDADINESGGLDNFRPDVRIVERDPIAVIIQHPTENLYLIAKWSNGWCGFLTGGIEPGDTLQDTVRKEILEETGYKNVAEILPMNCVSHGLFYHTVKQVNRFAHYHLVFAKLANLEKQEVSEEELAIAKFVWMKKSDIEDTLTRRDMKKLWRFYLESK